MTKDMTSGSPLRLILAFAVPLMLGSLFQQFYSMADTIIVGRFVGVEALAAVGRKNSGLMPWAVRWSTPRNSVITNSSSVPPPTPQAEMMLAPRPHKKGSSHSVTAGISPPRKRGRRRTATSKRWWTPGHIAFPR